MRGDSSPYIVSPLSRRRFLQGTLSSVGGFAAWHQTGPRRAAAQKNAPSGQATWAIHVTIAPTWFDPAETPGVITPYMFMYAMHDALVKPMPGNAMFPSLATAWRESEDGLAYEFDLRQGVKFHNGDPFTAEDVQYSYARYKGTGASELKKKIKSVDIVNAHRIRFQLHEPWPDFMTFYGSPATGAGWIVPQRYTESIGTEKFKEAPIGLGPYRFVSHTPGVELILEANTDYWRKTPHIKRLVMKSVSEATTRLAMLKKREADVTYGLYGALGEEVRRDPNLKLEPVHPPGTQWIVFTHQQYDPQSPWADQRVRLAANYALNRQLMNEAETLGHSVPTGGIIPRQFSGALALESYPYDPKRAKALLAEAGYAKGFDAGECGVDSVYAGVVEAAANDLAAIGIRLKVRPMERAAAFSAHKEKTFKHLAFQGSGAFGNAATRIEAFVYSKGTQSWIQDPAIDELYAKQAAERNVEKRQGMLHQIQQKLYDEARFIPIWELGFLCASGPRMAVSGLGLIPLFAYSGPYEDLQLKSLS